MTSKALGRARLAFIIGGLVVSACGGSTPSAAPTTVAATAAPQTFAPTPSLAPVTPPPPSAAPTPTAAAEIDPADDLEIAAPYTLEPLDAALADMFVAAMKDSMGAFADVFHVGVRSAVKDGETDAWVIIMEFPDLPVSETALLDGAAAGAAEGEIEKRTILDHPVRIIETGGLFAVLTVVDNELLMAMGADKAKAVAVVTALIEANG